MSVEAVTGSGDGSGIFSVGSFVDSLVDDSRTLTSVEAIADLVR